MKTYFDRCEAQLVRAAARQFPVDVRRKVPGRRWRAPLVVAGVLAIAGPAAALTRPWEPLLGDPKYGPSASVSADAPPPEQLRLLGVLRREPAGADRGSDVRAALRYVGAGASGVRTDYIRRLAVTADGRSVVLVPSERYGATIAADGEAIRDALCVIVPDPVAGAAKTCMTTDDVLAGRPASLGDTFYGLVPDGVAQVQIGTATATVHDNFFLLEDAPTAVGEPEFRWLDATGSPVRPLDP